MYFIFIFDLKDNFIQSTKWRNESVLLRTTFDLKIWEINESRSRTFIIDRHKKTSMFYWNFHILGSSLLSHLVVCHNGKQVCVKCGIYEKSHVKLSMTVVNKWRAVATIFKIRFLINDFLSKCLTSWKFRGINTLNLCITGFENLISFHFQTFKTGTTRNKIWQFYFSIHYWYRN